MKVHRSLAWAVGFILPAGVFAANTPVIAKTRIEAQIPVAVRGLMLDRPSVTFLVTIDETGRLGECMPTHATHFKLIEHAERALQHAGFVPAMRDDKPVPTTCEITVRLYDPAQRAYFEGGIALPPPNTASDLVESRMLKLNPEQFAYRRSLPRELDRPLQVTATKIMLYQDEQGRSASGRCLVEFWVDAQGVPHFPHVVSSDNEPVAMSAILTLRQTRFSPPTRNGQPTFVQVRQPMEFNLPAAGDAAEPKP